MRNEFQEERIPFDAHPFLAHITVARRIIAPQNTEINVPETHIWHFDMCALWSPAGETTGKYSTGRSAV